MLYGSDALRKEIMNDAFSYAQDNNLKLVYAAMVGSISQGLQYANSDYDTSFYMYERIFLKKYVTRPKWERLIWCIGIIRRAKCMSGFLFGKLHLFLGLFAVLDLRQNFRLDCII